MFPKLLAVILTAVVTAAGLLVIRQQRLETAHRASLVHRRLKEQQTSLWELHHRVSVECRPNAIRRTLETLDQRWVPIPSEPRRSPKPPMQVGDPGSPSQESAAG